MDPTKIRVWALGGNYRSLDVTHGDNYDTGCNVMTDDNDAGRIVFLEPDDPGESIVFYAEAAGRRLQRLWDDLYALARRSCPEAERSPLLVEYLLYLYFYGPAEVRFRVERLISLTRVRA